MAIGNTQNLQVGLNQVESFKPITMKQFDKNTRTIELILKDANGIYTIPEGTIAKMQATKKDNTIVFADCTIVNSTILFKAPEQFTTVVGDVLCEIGLYFPDPLGDTSKDELIQSATFKVEIIKSAMDRNGIESSSEFITLTLMINTASGLIEEINTKLPLVDSAISEAETATNNTVQATTNANTATTNANNAADLANTKAGLADTATSNAITATTNADTATQDAILAAEEARQAANEGLPNLGVAGTYNKVTTDTKGRVSSASLETTIGGLGITDVYTKEEVNTNDTKDNVVSFVEAPEDVDVTSNEKHETIISKFVKSIKTFRNAIGVLSTLATTDKTSLVNAINELNDNKIANAKIANNDITTEAGLVWDARRGKAIRDDLTATNNNLALQTTIVNVSIAGASGSLKFSKFGKFVQVTGVITCTTNLMIGTVLVTAVNNPCGASTDRCINYFGSTANYAEVREDGSISMINLLGATAYRLNLTYVKNS